MSYVTILLAPGAGTRRPARNGRYGLPGILLAGAFLILAAAGSAQPGGDDPPSAGSRFRPAQHNAIEQEWLVALQDHVGNSPLRANAGQPPLDEVAETLALAFGGEVLRVWGWTTHGFALRISPEDAERLSRHPFVRFVEQNARLDAGLSATIRCNNLDSPTPAPDPPPPTSTASPQPIYCTQLDPRFNHDCIDNWGLARGSSIDVPIFSPSTPPTYSHDYDGSGVHVYVIDIGIDFNHAEFRETSSPLSPLRIGGGYNAVFPPTGCYSPPSDLGDCFGNGHGTHVSAIVGGLRYGVAKGATLHPIKYADKCAPCSSGICGSTKSDVVTAINRSVAINDSLGSPPAVINFSSNFPAETDPINQSILVGTVNNAILVYGIPFVQSAGNQFDYLRAGQVRDACSMTLTNNAIIVGATDLVDLGTGLTDVRWVMEGPANSGPSAIPDLEYSSFGANCHHDANPGALVNVNCGSNTGACIDVWAPGAHIVSARRNTVNDDCHLAGTSMAAPQVTGLVAQLLEQYPSAPPAELELAVRDYAVAGTLYTGLTFPYYSIKSSPNLLFQTLPPVITDAWVEFSHTNVIELGTQNLPFDTLTEGLAETDSGHTLHVEAGSSAGAVTINQDVTIVAEGGTVTIGQ